MIVLVLRTKPSGLYRHRTVLGFTQSRLQRRKSNIRIAKVVFHTKESPIRTRDEVLSLVSSWSNSPAKVYSPAVRLPPNPGLPHSCPYRTTSFFLIFLNIPKLIKIAIRIVLESVYLPPIPFLQSSKTRKKQKLALRSRLIS